MRTLALTAAVLAVTLACATDKPKPPPAEAVVDEDAPAPDTWSAMHAKGTRVALPRLDPIRLPSVGPRGEALERVDVGGIAAVIVRPARMPSTSDTPLEKLPGVVVVAPPGPLESADVVRIDSGGADALVFASAGNVVIVPQLRYSDDGFTAVDDARAAARFLASEPDVDVDRLYAFGDALVVDQLALGESPFRAVGSLGATSAASLKRDNTALADANERIARALLPHALEITVRLVVFAAPTDAVASAVHARNPRIELHTEEPIRGFVDVIAQDAPPAVAFQSNRFLNGFVDFQR